MSFSNILDEWIFDKAWLTTENGHNPWFFGGPRDRLKWKLKERNALTPGMKTFACMGFTSY